MQAVILAAGMGKRLKNKTKNHTKSMVEILEKSFLEHSLDKITKFEINRIVIVIGYCGDEIKDIIGDKYNNIPVIYVNNENYATTNNIFSLYLAKDYLLEDDTLLFESDLIYEEKIIKNLLDNPFPNLAVVDKYQPYMDGTVVKINDANEITAFIPKKHFDYRDIDSYYKTVNIYKFSKDFLKNDYLPFLEAYCKAMGNNEYYEQVLRVLLSLEKNNMRVLKLNGEKWYEVDDLQDYDIAETLFCQDNKLKLKKYHSRYGGYWRFKELKDFCYLVNPYFPTKRMFAEIKNSLKELICSYPSGQSVQKILLANIFGLKESQLLLGNGAAELINATLQEVTGDVGIILPTFQEYVARLTSKTDIHYFTPDNNDFSYNKNDIINFSKDINTLVLVNPDNPSGNYINKDSLLEILDYFKDTGKTLILDESFADFASFDVSLLNIDIIEKYPNLVIIKSISKSYGIPGLRLGVLATSNNNLIDKIYKNIPVWNVNSIGEFFLQILNKYQKEYKIACSKIIKNRNDFYKKLQSINYLRPIPSAANYILCEVLPPYTAEKICIELIEKDILIKDCQNKLGFDGKQYIRLAVNAKEDNDMLISILELLS